MRQSNSVRIQRERERELELDGKRVLQNYRHSKLSNKFASVQQHYPPIHWDESVNTDFPILRNLHIVYDHFGVTEFPPNLPRTLFQLSISSTSLSSLPENLNQTLPQLVHLDVYLNPKSPFPKNLPKSLEHLCFRSKPISTILHLPDVDSPNPTIPNDLNVQLPNLSFLCLRVADLATFPQNLPESLTYLSLTAFLSFQNKDFELPDISSTLPHLRHLILSNVRGFPPFSNLPQTLHTLSIESSYIFEPGGDPVVDWPLEEKISKHLPQLHVLKLKSAHLSKIGFLPLSLFSLSCPNNQIFDFPCKLHNITNLDLSHNKLNIISIQHGAKVSLLKELSLNSNTISELPDNFALFLHSLEKLHLGSNRIKNFPIHLPQSLYSLNLFRNQIKDIGTVSISTLLPNLVELNLARNYLTKFPLNLPASLLNLNLSYNSIFQDSTTDPPLVFPPKLEILSVLDCSLYGFIELLPKSLIYLRLDSSNISPGKVNPTATPFNYKSVLKQIKSAFPHLENLDDIELYI